MKIDPIVKEELWRSLPVYFISFLIIGYLDREGYISVGTTGTFILAFLVTAIHFLLMVWYRKKEQIDNPSIFLIIDHIFRSKIYEEKTSDISKKKEISIFSSIRKDKRLLILIILLYIAYIYASLVYNIDQIFWILFLLFMGFAISKIIYGESTEADQKDPMRFLVFYVTACIFIFVRYLVLGYPILPILKWIMVFGILVVLMILGKKWSQRKQNSDN